MAKAAVVFNRFDGGLSTDQKVGIPHSFANSQCIDFRKKPSQFSVLPGLTREDRGVVTDLVQNCTLARNGTVYSIGSTGKIYGRDSSGLWSNIGSIGSVGTFGIDYRQDTNTVYITGTTTVSALDLSYGLRVGKYATSYSTYNNSTATGFNVSAFQEGSTSSYTLTTTVSENEADLRYFQSDIEPLSSVGVFVTSKGSGDWTITVHDGLNNSLGTATVTNANLTVGAFNLFEFSTPIRLYVAPNSRTYHFHLTSTVAGGTISSEEPNHLNECDLEIYANRLVTTTNGLHPMTRFQQYTCIGNGNYLSVWEPLSDPPTNDEWQRHRLVFPSEYEVCGLAVFNEYLAIALQKIVTTNAIDAQEGIIAWWDGTNPENKANYFTKIPEGAPFSIHEYENNIYYYAGGAEYRIDSPNSIPVKIRTMPNSDTEFSGNNIAININPYMATVRRGIHLFGYPSSTINTGVTYGVYSWGSIDQTFPQSFGYSYRLSSGNTHYDDPSGNQLKIGMVKSYSNVLLVSWQDDSVNLGLPNVFGVDAITNSTLPSTDATWESIIFDDGFPAKIKKALYMQATFETLPSDASFILKYKINRGSWVESDSFTASSFTDKINVARFDVTDPSEFTEFQVGIDITSGTTTPIFTSISFVYDNNEEEALS